MDSAIFTSQNGSIPWLEVSLQPPVIVFYFFLGWCYAKLYRDTSLACAIRLAVLVFLWRVFFIETVWYIEPSFAEQTWKTFFNLVPSIAVVIGWCFANKLLKSGTPQSGTI